MSRLNKGCPVLLSKGCHARLDTLCIVTFAALNRGDIAAGAYLVNVAVKQPSSHCRDPAVAERLWEETDRQIKAALS